MEEQTFDPKAARDYIVNRFKEQGDFMMFGQETMEKMVDQVIALDAAYMKESGVDDGAVYDDDAAYEYMHAHMIEAFPEHKMYMMRLVDDYLDYNEAYLDSIGAIDWE